MVWKEYEAICEKLIETNQEKEKDMTKGDSNEEGEEDGMDMIDRLYRYKYMDMMGWIWIIGWSDWTSYRLIVGGVREEVSNDSTVFDFRNQKWEIAGL